ncbi:MAG: DUF4139 domain-containing protein [Vampirovibrionales bacterium]|nr:DUF4139 domain-containing protein [Vampirovibrionales bacterium]
MLKRFAKKTQPRPQWGMLMLALMLSPIAGTLSILPASAESPEITVYNQNFGVVKDYQTLALKSGRNEVQLDTVAALIDPTSVHFKSLSDPKGVSVEEQNFRYDLINKANILNRMVGKRIRFVKDGQVKEGILLNPPTAVTRPHHYGNTNRYAIGNVVTENTSDFAVKTTEGVLLTTLNDILIDELPQGLYARPTLVWQLFSESGGNHKTEVSYMTDGLNWNADYVAVLSADDSKVDLSGWVTLDNQSGTSYQDAKLKLVAGDVRRVQDNAGGYPVPMMAKAAMMEDARQGFSEESFFEYHLYTLDQKTTISDKETKQMALLSANNIPVTKKFIYDPQRQYQIYSYSGGRPGQGGSTSTDNKVAIMVSLKNSKDNHLGMALPKGKIRMNKADSSGALQFIGEDQIDHTAKDESIELYVGDAFDVVGEKKRTNYQEDFNSYNSTYQVTLKNHKDQAVTVHAYEHLYGDWKVASSSHKYEKPDATTLSFPVSVPANGTSVVTYTVEVAK